MSHRIVVVEDEVGIQSLIVEELEDEGYDVATACNGQEGIEVIQSFKPHLVLSDITMPVMNGHEMLVSLRENYPNLRSVPIVFLSALADRRHIIEGKKLGVDDYVTKPIDFELLLATIESRIREIERITAEKEEQMFKLYQSLVKQSEESSKPMPALMVSSQWSNIESVKSALDQIGVPLVWHHRGSQLDQYLSERTYSVVLIEEQTDDVSAKVALTKSKNFTSCAAPKVLLVEKGNNTVDRSYWGSFSQVLAPNASVDQLVGALSKLFPAQAA